MDEGGIMFAGCGCDAGCAATAQQRDMMIEPPDCTFRCHFCTEAMMSHQRFFVRVVAIDRHTRNPGNA